MTWLTITAVSYLILAVVFLIDKYLLTGPIPNPKVYAFYSGTLGILILLFAPFVGFFVPSFSQIMLSFAAGFLFVFGLYRFYKALQLYEPSRIVPAIGGLLPLFTFCLIFIFSKGEALLGSRNFFAFLLLVLGSVLITYKSKELVSGASLKAAAFAALPFSFYIVFSKYVFLAQPFWNGLIWIRIGAFLGALAFLFLFSEVKEEIFKKKQFVPKSPALFFFNQGLGAGGNILLNWAIALAPLAYVAVVNALQGLQYAFLLFFAVFLSFKFPNILKEEVSRDVLLQKIIAILLIGGGLVLLLI